MSNAAVAKMTFEQAMKELESVVGKLEAGDVSLEESIDLYKRGASLKAHCDARLVAAAEQVDLITLGEKGAPSGKVSLTGDTTKTSNVVEKAAVRASVDEDEIPF